MTAIESWSMGAWSWLLTYLVHSTILLSLAWCVSTRMFARITSERIVEAAWKTALVAGVFSATLQHVMHIGPFTLQWDLAAAMRPERPTTAHTRADGDLDPNAASNARPPQAPAMSRETLGDIRRSSDTVASSSQAPGTTTLTGVTRPAFSTPPASGEPFSRAMWVGLLISCIMAVGLGWSILDCWRLHRWARQDVVDGRVCAIFRDVRSRMGVTRSVRLTQSEHVIVPIVFGLKTAEVCLPRRAIEEMDDESLRCVFAHELAHVLRQDMEWRWIGLLVERVLFVQPLNRVARRNLSQLAEYGCDELAARKVGGALPIARCLTTVAAWTQEASARSRPVRPTSFAASMAPLPSTLGRRVERLMATANTASHANTGRRAPTLLAIGVTVAMSTACIPVVSAVREPVMAIEEHPVASLAPGATFVSSDLDTLTALLTEDVASLASELEALRVAVQQSERVNEDTTVVVDRLFAETRRLQDAVDLIVAYGLSSYETTNPAQPSR